MQNQERRPAPSACVIHDLSGVGRCALTVVIPVLAAMGVQPCPLPTAVLSTHTGGYEGMAQRDLTGFIPECIGHWKRLGLRFDALYSGYLASVEQVDMILGLFAWQKEGRQPLVVVDPVLGDEGQLYSSMPASMPGSMRALCGQADVITPNLTEVGLLLEEPYSHEPRSPREVMRTLARLCELGARAALVTSMPVGQGRVANVCARAGEKGYWQCAYHPVPVHYPGTGDLFSSVLTGALLRGEGMPEAMERATRYVYRAVRDTQCLDTEVRAGVQLERSLGALLEPMGRSELEWVGPEA